ncbi:D-alanyl-D-alanine carboxypeptidase family protein [Amorphus sp. MBR-141]
MPDRVAMLSRIRKLAALVCLAAVAAAGPARAEIGSYLVFDVNTGAILDEHNATKPWYPASLTKLMTVYVTFRAIDEGRITLKSPVVISAESLRAPPSKMGFPVGSVITVDTALKILMVKSANDVAVALGEAVEGSEAGFVRAMNREARRIGMTQSNYANPHGLPDKNHVSSARDLAILVTQIRKEFPDYDDLFQITALKLGNHIYKNHNYLVAHFPGTTGMKTGFICSSGFNLAATAKRGGREIAAIVLGGYTSRERNEETAKLLEIGFRTRTGFLSGNRKSIDDLRKASVTAGTPVDLRPIVCGGKRPKTAYSDRSNVVAYDELDEDEVATAYAANSRDPFAKLLPGGKQPVLLNSSGGQVISYLRNDLTVGPPTEIFMGGATGPQLALDEESGEMETISAASIPVPRPRPLFSMMVSADRIDPAEVMAIAASIRHSNSGPPVDTAAAPAAPAPLALVSTASAAEAGPEPLSEPVPVATAAPGDITVSWFPRPKPAD